MCRYIELVCKVATEHCFGKNDCIYIYICMYVYMYVCMYVNVWEPDLHGSRLVICAVRATHQFSVVVVSRKPL